MNTLSTSKLQHLLDDVFLLVQNDMVSAVLARKISLLLSRGGADDRGAARFRDLRKEETQSTSDGVHQNGIPSLDIVCLGHDSRRSQALQEGRGRSFRRDGVRNRDSS